MHRLALRIGLLMLAVVLAASGQAKMTVSQLVSFVQSSIQLKHPDKQVADYLKRVTLTERLSVSTVEDLQGLGAGPRTLEALRQLQEASARLAPPAPKPVKPPPKPIPPPSAAEQKRILAEVREYALSYVKRLPDFICTQVTRRYVDPSGLEIWQRQDVVTARLSYFEQREDYKVILVNNRMVDASLDSIGGATSTGEFGSMLREVFEPETEAAFTWHRWTTLRGRRAHVFSYRVAQPKSKWRLSYQRQLEILTAYRGLVYVDAEIPMVLRITLEAVDVPPTFPIQQASTVLDYDFIEIAEQQYVLPLRAVVRMREGRLLAKNEVEFRLYRKFGADTVITFDTPDPLPEDEEQPPTP